MLKTASRRTTQTTTEAAEGLIGNKIANRIKKTQNLLLTLWFDPKENFSIKCDRN